jgi:flagellar hook protein FlgE
LIRREMMISPVNSSVSAINAALQMQAASAHNVSNAQTDKFKSTVVTAQEHENGGVKVTLSHNPEPGAVYDNGYGKVAESSNVNYARERVNQISARNLFAANIASLKTFQDMNETLIDIMA